MDREKQELLVISGRRSLVRTLRLQWSELGLAVRHLPPDVPTLDETQLERAVLVVVDLDLVEPNGLELCERLGASRAVPFIVLLPRPDPSLATLILDRGADDCLAGPVSLQELSLRTRAILRRTGAPLAAPPQPASSKGTQIGDGKGKSRAEAPGNGKLNPERGRSDPRGRRRAALTLAGILIGISVLLASFRWGNGYPVQEQSASDAGLNATVGPLLERLRQDPSDKDALVDLGDAFYDHSEWEDAIAWYEDALYADEGNTDVRARLGTAYFYSGNLEKAKQQWLRVLEMDPDEVQAHYGLAMLYSSQTPPDSEAAAREWETVIRLAPGSQEAGSAERQLETLGKR